MSERFSRTAMLIGQDGLELLKRKKVAVFGLGGVGSFVVEGLARAGVGGFYLVDHDIVDVSNINRQLHALTCTIGKPKVELMAERVKQINPEAEVTVLQKRYLPGGGSEVIPSGLDYLVDAVDDVPAKVDLVVYSLKMRISVISSMGAGNRLDPGMFMVADVSRTSNCPLARAFRRELRKAGITEGVKVVFSTEKPLLPQGHNFHNVETGIGPSGRRLIGSISFVPSVAGLITAAEVVKDLLIPEFPITRKDKTCGD